MNNLSSISDATVTWAQQRHVEVRFANETTSTNDDAKAQALNDPDDLVLYLTNHQTTGRGRGTNVWLDTGNGENLLCTWSFPLSTAPQPITAPRIGLALFQAVHRVWPSLEWSLKAPNDLYLKGHKVGGLLLETVSHGAQYRLLVGLGLNVLNHPRRLADADHMSEALQSNVDTGEWFQFLDELRTEFTGTLLEASQETLTAEACRKLTEALNANSQRPYVVQQVTPQGDLIHSLGRISWKDI